MEQIILGALIFISTIYVLDQLHNATKEIEDTIKQESSKLHERVRQSTNYIKPKEVIEKRSKAEEKEQTSEIYY